MHMNIHQGGLIPGYVDSLTCLACYLAAVSWGGGHMNIHQGGLIPHRPEPPIGQNPPQARTPQAYAQGGELHEWSSGWS